MNLHLFNNYTMKKILLYITIIAFVTSCKKTTDDNGLPEQVLKDVVYASTNALQNMDVYLPANRSTATTYPIILVHGGSWSGGDKTDFDADIASIKAALNNYAVFNINYRLANGTSVLVQQQIDDINAAINFIDTKANEYQINTSKIGIVGASAGAHLSLLKAYKYNTDNKIKAVVDLFGPTNMEWMYNNHPMPTFSQPIIQNVIGFTPTTNPTAYFNASPINFVSSSVPPTIIFHGTADLVVPISESNQLQTALATAGVNYKYYTYIGESHGWTGTNLTDTHNKIIAFIKKYVK